MSESTACFLVERRDGQFRRVAGGEVICETHFLLPVGAMWWRDHTVLDNGPEARPMPHLAVMTPAGLWCIDCPSSDDRTYWTRTGEPPDVTVAPSVNINHEEWHGWLKKGRLVR